MQAVNATPPADFPSEVIVLDREHASRHPGHGFYLRRQAENGDVEKVDLTPEYTLTGAVQVAVSKGYAPTHWMDTTATQPSELPEAIQRDRSRG